MNTDIPSWMREGTEFDTLWNAWQEGHINYLQFAKALQEVDDVPDDVKENHINSAYLIRQEMNKALHVYSYVRKNEPEFLDMIMDEYDPDKTYAIVMGVQSYDDIKSDGSGTIH